METPATPVTHYKHYNASFKIDVINSTKVFNNNSEAARKHGVDVRNVRRWRVVHLEENEDLEEAEEV